MGTAQTLMVVATQPSHPLLEDEYNAWYSDNHLPYVLLSEGFSSASRFRLSRLVKGSLPPYLALYQADWDDPWDAQRAYAAMRQAGVGAQWNQSPGQSLAVAWWSYYGRIAQTGAPAPAQDPPGSILVTFARPDGGKDTSAIFLADQVEAWFGRFLHDLERCPQVRGSTLYRLGLAAGGDTPPLYMTVHELDGAGGAAHDHLMAWMRSARLDSDTDAVIAANAPVALDGWAYYDRMVTCLAATEDELLHRPEAGPIPR